MKLLEIVRGRETSKEVIATSLKLAKKLGKVGVVVGNCFGFVANRMLAYYMREAYLLLEEGASVEQIDQRADRVRPAGRPVRHAGHRRHRRRRAHPAVSEVDRQDARGRTAVGRFRISLFEMGRYGQKTGAGWYRYDAPGSRNRIADPLIDQLAERGGGEARHHAARRSPTRRSSRGSRRRSPTKARACSRKATRRAPATSTSSTCYGFGFPRHRGGPMFYADTVGLATVLTRVNEYRARFGDYWEPAPLLEKLVAEGRGFYGCGSHGMRRPERPALRAPMIELDVHALADRVGQEIAVGDWLPVAQERIQQFADATGDHQWIHVDRGARGQRNHHTRRRSRTAS